MEDNVRKGSERDHENTGVLIKHHMRLVMCM